MTASRRDFLRNSGLVVMAGAGFLTTDQWLRGADAGSSPGSTRSDSEGDRRETPTVVTIFLRGGADALNALVPYGEDAYYKARPKIAVPAAPKNGKAVLKLSPKIGRDYFGLNPYLDGIHALVEAGDCVPVINVGSPDGTRSHFSAQDYMERGAPGNPRVTTGWLNRYLQLTRKQTDAPLRGLCAEALLPRALRGPYPVLAGANKAQDMRLFEDLYSPDNLVNQTAREGANADHGSRLDSLNADDPKKAKQMTSDTVRDVISDSGTNAVARLKALDAAMAAATKGDYPAGRLGAQLRTIAQVIKANVGLEVAQADFDGWDHHSDQGDVNGKYSRMLKTLSDCIVAFHKDLGPRMSKTLILVMSEFGRTVEENGSMGTDHGRGGWMLAVGKNLNGGKFYGTWKTMEDLADARFQPVHTDFRAVMAESMMKLFGVDPVKAAALFPGYRPAAKDYLNFMKPVKSV